LIIRESVLRKVEIELLIKSSGNASVEGIGDRIQSCELLQFDLGKDVFPSLP